MELHIWLAFVAASTALLLIPGPTVLLVLSYSISRGRQAALATVAGVALGDFIAMTASLAGLGALVLASATLFTVLKWIGVVYLIYMGIKLFRSAASAQLQDLAAQKDLRQTGIFTHAALVTALNPKSIVFFIAFVPQFVRAEQPLLPQFVVLIATFVVLAALNALVYALLASQLSAKISRPSVLKWISRAGGSALVAMGLATALAKRA